MKFRVYYSEQLSISHARRRVQKAWAEAPTRRSDWPDTMPDDTEFVPQSVLQKHQCFIVDLDGVGGALVSPTWRLSGDPDSQ